MLHSTFTQCHTTPHSVTQHYTVPHNTTQLATPHNVWQNTISHTTPHSLPHNPHSLPHHTACHTTHLATQHHIACRTTQLATQHHTDGHTTLQNFPHNTTHSLPHNAIHTACHTIPHRFIDILKQDSCTDYCENLPQHFHQRFIKTTNQYLNTLMFTIYRIQSLYNRFKYTNKNKQNPGKNRHYLH